MYFRIFEHCKIFLEADNDTSTSEHQCIAVVKTEFVIVVSLVLNLVL